MESLSKGSDKPGEDDHDNLNLTTSVKANDTTVDTDQVVDLGSQEAVKNEAVLVEADQEDTVQV